MTSPSFASLSEAATNLRRDVHKNFMSYLFWGSHPTMKCPVVFSFALGVMCCIRMDINYQI